MRFIHFNHGRGYWYFVVLATVLFIFSANKVIDIILKPDEQDDLGFKTFAWVGVGLGILPALLIFGYFSEKL